MRSPLVRLTAIVVTSGLLVGIPWSAARAQPDLRQMAGTPLPTADLPNGAVSVRVVRGEISHNLPDRPVQLTGGASPLEAVTDAQGRASFEDVPDGVMLQAVAVVDGERLESQPFQRPGQGGVRLLLVAGLGEAGAPEGTDPETDPGETDPEETDAETADQPAASPGEVTLSNDSRFIVELAEGSLEVFGALELVNLRATPVQPSAPIVFEVPPGALSTTILDGSTSQARVEGGRVEVAGPFAPGRTPLQFAYRVPYEHRRAIVEQRLPLAVGQLNVAVRRVEGLQISVAGATEQRETTFNGRMYAIAGGTAVPQGGTIRIELDGLPHHPRWPLYVAFGLAAGLLLVAGVLSMTRARDDAPTRAALEARRRELLDALAAIERAHAAGSLDADARRDQRAPLVAALEAIYEQLDRLQPRPRAPQHEDAAANVGSNAASPDPLARA